MEELIEASLSDVSGTAPRLLTFVECGEEKDGLLCAPIGKRLCKINFLLVQALGTI